MNERSIVGRDIQLTKDYTTGNATFKQGRRGTVIEATSRKDRKLKVKFNKMLQKNINLFYCILLFSTFLPFLLSLILQQILSAQ